MKQLVYYEQVKKFSGSITRKIAHRQNLGEKLHIGKI